VVVVVEEKLKLMSQKVVVVVEEKLKLMIRVEVDV
jgi:hypothetical protein